MATKAADLLQKDGPDKAFAAFNAGGGWRDGDLYVFVIDKTGTWRASGARPELIGTKVDLDKPVVKEMLAIDKNGWVAYSLSPADNQEHDKSFVRGAGWKPRLGENRGLGFWSRWHLYC